MKIKILNMEILEWHDFYSRFIHIDGFKFVRVIEIRYNNMNKFTIHALDKLSIYNKLFNDLGSFNNLEAARIAADELLMKLSKNSAFL